MTVFGGNLSVRINNRRSVGCKGRLIVHEQRVDEWPKPTKLRDDEIQAYSVIIQFGIHRITLVTLGVHAT
jgi:hypothetical protein